MQILRADDYRSMPWKNGGGVTTEIAISPAGARLDDFNWRLSMAKVESGGPFSSFPGIDRTLSILEGEGIMLAIDGREPTRLDKTSMPLRFRADVPTEAELVGGAILDLNVMTCRKRCEHSVERVELKGSMELNLDADATLIFKLDGDAEVHSPVFAQLGPRDTLVLTRADAPLKLSSQLVSTLFVVQIHETSGEH